MKLQIGNFHITFTVERISSQQQIEKAKKIMMMDDKVRSLLIGQLYIEAIKEVRACTGLGLKEAKDYVDSFPERSQIKLNWGRGR